MLSVLVVGGVSATAWYTWQLTEARAVAESNALQATREAAKASQVAEFLKDLLAASKPSNARGEDVTVRQVLDVGVERVRSDLDEPELKANLLEIMGDVYADLGDFPRAEALLLDSVSIYREIGGPLELAAALEEYGQLLRSRGDWQASIPVLEEALSIARDVPNEVSVERQANILNSLGFTASKLNRFEASERYYRDALALRQAHFGEEHAVTAQTLSGLGFLLYKTGQYEESIELMGLALDVADREHGPYHPVISTRALNLSSAYLRLGLFPEAEALILRAIDVDEQLYGPDHHYVASGLLSLGALYREQLDFRKAAETLEKALPIETAALGDRHIDTGQTRVTLAYYYAKVGRVREAQSLIVDAQTILDDEALGEHHYVLQLLRSRGALSQAQSNFEEALGHFEQAIEMAVRMYGDDHHRADLITGAARANASLGRFQPAASLYADAIRRMEQESARPRPALIEVREAYADVLAATGDTSAARAFREATAAMTGAAAQPD